MTMCPCGSKRDFDECCGPIIAGAPAPTAEALMRSRYTAFAQRTLDHIDRTHAPEVRDDFNRAEAERLAEECEWQSLEIRKAIETGDTAEIEFVVRFRRERKDITQAALSRFRRDNGQWLYVSSDLNPHIPQQRVSKVGRNDPCPCNSGKKAKKCCGTTTELK
ncbi:MAG: YchJ family metal-binding protein [Desulfocapsaceae bacterium]|nr:YchJ family metal-binding protein [Desulfocapsaceae bacterium]